MRESGVVSVGTRSILGPRGTSGARTPPSTGVKETLSYAQASGNHAFLTHLGRMGVQRKCAKCEEDEEENVSVRRAPRGPTALPSLSGLGSAAEPLATPAPTPEPVAPSPDTRLQETPGPSTEGELQAGTPAPALLVDDETENVGPDQMKKTAFLAALRPAVCAAVDEGLASTGRTSDGCPHVEYWFAHLAEKDASFIERGIQRFAPEARNVRTANEYVAAVATRVRESTEIWARTGEVQGVPAELAGAVAAGAAGAAAPAGGAAQSGLTVRFHARPAGARVPDSPAAVRDALGRGRPLDARVRARMESAYGVRFDNVQIHTDVSGARLSDQLNARAFAVGEHVAFGAGEYRPGTILGDALIAHELAHVVQQRGPSESGVAMSANAGTTQAMEHEADSMAASAVGSQWNGRGGFARGSRKVISRLRSGLALQRCNRTPSSPTLTFRQRGSLRKADCGGYEWEIGWLVRNATKTTNGVIVQKVELVRDVKDCSSNSTAYNGKGLDPAWYPVWEAWDVNAGVVSPAVGNVNDIFSADPLGDNTKGSVTMIGTAEYYDGATLPSSFAVSNAEPTWSLPATNTEPTIAGGTGTVDHRLTATWDCCTTDKKTTVTTSSPP